MFLFSSWTSLSERQDNDIHIFDVLPLAAAVYIFLKTDPRRAQDPRHTRTIADLLAAIARLLARRQLHNAPSLQTAWTIQQILCAEYHILEVFEYELITPTQAALIEVFERRLSLWEGQQIQQPCHPHIPLLAPIVFADGTHLFAEAYVRDHSLSVNSSASQIGASAWFMSVAFWVCLELVGARLRGHNSASHLLWVFATQQSFSVLCMLLPARTGSVPDTFSPLLGVSQLDPVFFWVTGAKTFHNWPRFGFLASMLLGRV